MNGDSYAAVKSSIDAIEVQLKGYCKSLENLRNGLRDINLVYMKSERKITGLKLGKYKDDLLQDESSGSDKEGCSEGTSIPPELKKYYDNAKYLISKINEVNPNDVFDYELSNFKKIYESNLDLYIKISEETGVPPELVAAFHYRESNCDFNTYLHNGQELGTPTTIVPKDRIFNDFSKAAIDALESELKSKGIHLTLNSDIITMMTFAEIYNGTGYTDYTDIASPYVYSGTNVYEKSKYTSDGKFNPEVIDKQPGVYMLVMAILDK